MGHDPGAANSASAECKMARLLRHKLVGVAHKLGGVITNVRGKARV